MSEPKTELDPDFSPQYFTNQEAAKKQGVRFCNDRGYYVDEAGALVRDRFGQPL